jgi:ATP-dependent Clp protease ATP-binding subunit ClpC
MAHHKNPAVMWLTTGKTRMFERYTEKARRVIFFARYEASQFGAKYVQPEHIVLGLFREDKALVRQFLSSHAASEELRKQSRSDSRMAKRS